MVYHGTVNGFEHVAVKVLSQSSTQGYKEFKAEVFKVLKSFQLLNMICYFQYQVQKVMDF